MMMRCSTPCARIVLLFVFCLKAAAYSGPPPETYKDTLRLLHRLESPRINSKTLAILFEVGDSRIADLIRALNEPDREISLRAQIVIRYLGNADGMNALENWYGQQNGFYAIAGPIPLPLGDRDYQFIKTNVQGKPTKT